MYVKCIIKYKELYWKTKGYKWLFQIRCLDLLLAGFAVATWWFIDLEYLFGLYDYY